MEQACRDAAGEGRAEAGQHRQSAPTARRSPSCARCTGAYRGTGRPGDGAQDGRSSATRGANTRRPGRHASRLRLATQVGRARLALSSSSHSTLPSTCAQQPHPDVEDGRRDLVAVVERSRTRSRFRAGPPRRGSASRSAIAALRIVGGVAVGQVDDLLAVARALLVRNDEAVGDDVVDVVGAHRARIAQVVDLDRRRPGARIPGRSIAGEALQVDRDVDLHVARSGAATSDRSIRERRRTGRTRCFSRARIGLPSSGPWRWRWSRSACGRAARTARRSR